MADQPHVRMQAVNTVLNAIFDVAEPETTDDMVSYAVQLMIGLFDRHPEYFAALRDEMLDWMTEENKQRLPRWIDECVRLVQVTHG